MKISGFVKNSFVDYPGKISAVLFTRGCNMDCIYCQNRHLLNDDSMTINSEDIYAFLEKRKNLIDAIVITGGEPTIQKDLISFIQRLKQFNLLIKLDTNGTNPEIIKYLLENNLVDYIAMDIKSTEKKYSQVCRSKIDINKIKQSIELLKNSRICYEFRTTCYPSITSEDILNIASGIKGSEMYVLQKYRNMEEYSKKGTIANIGYLDLKNKISHLFQTFELRGM